MGNDPLLLKLKAGEPDAFKELYTAFYDMLYVKAFSVVRDEFVAKDLVQDCFIEIFEKKTYTLVHTSLQALLIVIVRRKCCVYLRNQRRLREKVQKYRAAEVIRQEFECIDFLSSHIQQHEIQVRDEKLRKALTNLSPQEKKVVDQVYVYGKSHADAAEATGMNHHTFHTYIYRAVNKLKKYVQLAS